MGPLSITLHSVQALFLLDLLFFKCYFYNFQHPTFTLIDTSLQHKSDKKKCGTAQGNVKYGLEVNVILVVIWTIF